MKKLIILAAILLAGCSSHVPGWKVLEATKICQERGGVDSLTTLMGIYVTCRDGSWFEIKLK